MDNITVSVADHSNHKDIVVLTVKGFIDTTTAPEFEKKFLGVLSDKKYKLIVDLKMSITSVPLGGESSSAKSSASGPKKGTSFWWE